MATLVGIARALDVTLPQLLEYNNDNERAARALRVPTLVVDAGARDLRELEPVRSIPSAQLGVTVGAGHFLQLEAPDQLNAMLRKFLDGLDRRPR